MPKLNCYVIDYEQHARDLLQYYIEKDERLFFLGSNNNVASFNPVGLEIDLLFLDIEMPGMNGVEFLEKHRPSFKTILTTAFRQYALEGYELGVTDYLLKPILFNRFEKAIQRVWEEVEKDKKAEKFDQHEAEKEAFIIRSGAKSINLIPENIIYIEAKEEYISINTIDNRYMVYMRMKQVEENGHFDNLVRIHRSFIINPKSIQERTSEYVLINDIQIPIGRSYKRNIKLTFNH